MIDWYYQIMKHNGSEADNEWYAIHEVYVYNNGEISWTDDEIEPSGETKFEVVETLKMMLEDVKKRPVLDFKTGKSLTPTTRGKGGV